jgi:AcrR family transcriptional regulator
MVTSSGGAGDADGVFNAADIRRREIAGAAANLFAERGYDRTSMNNVADLVGISKPTLYHYFTSKADILLYLHEDFMMPLLVKHEQLLANGTQPSELIRTIVRDIFAVVETQRGQVRVFNENYKELPLAQQMHARVKRDAYQRIIESAIEQGIRSGEYVMQKSVRLTALALLGMVNSAYQWYHEGPFTADEIAEIFADLFLRGLVRRSS